MRRIALLVVLLAGCGGQAPQQVRQVDPFPLYELTTTAPTPTLERASGGGACTVFFARGVLGRNFDFDDHPALLLHHRPPGAYRSVSLVDIAYLGVERGETPTAEDLAGASRLPFDGMNERGVAVAMAAVPQARSPRGDAVGSLGVMRLVLDRAADVNEAIKIFRTTAVDFTGGPPLHYMVADATGASAVIEYVKGRVHVIRRAQVMTNFVLTGDAPADDRYRTATAGLGSTDALALLERVKQPHTRWSVAYDLRARTVRVVMGQRYGRVHTFNL
jgi:Linear amide C-N hydrolases, choloylglycine hydrolase family